MESAKSVTTKNTAIRAGLGQFRTVLNSARSLFSIITFRLSRDALFLVVLLSVFLINRPGPVSAQDGLFQLVNPVMGHLRFSVDYQGWYYPTQDIEGQNQDLGLTQHQVEILAPLRQDQTQELGLVIKAQEWVLDTEAVLPDSGRSLPNELQQVGLGAFYRRQAANGWTWGVLAGVDSPAEQPFNSEDEIVLSATGFARIPQGPTQAWLVFLNYSNFSDYWDGLPLGGLAWQYLPSPRTQMLLGVPVVWVRHLPTKSTNLSLLYLLPQTVSARAGWRPTEGTETYINLAAVHEGFFLNGRRDKNNRLFFYETKALVGCNFQVSENINLDLAGGWVFERMVFEGENFGDRAQNRLDMESGSTFRLKVEVTF